MALGESQAVSGVMGSRSLVLVKLVSAILTLLLCCDHFAVIYAADYNLKECFDGLESNPPGNVTLTCPQGDVISVDEALFGRNKWLACVITEGDCVEKTKIFQSCDGLNNCERTFKTYSPQCGYISVLLLSYSCVQSFQTTEATTTTSTEERNYIWERQPTEGALTTPTQQTKNNDKDPNEIGLIIGCVVAAIATIIALVIAIVMVIRRLLQYRTKDRSDAVTDAEDPRNDNGFPCMDPLSCCSPSENTQDTNMMKKTASASNTGHSLGKVKTKSKTRMAPVGQESSTLDLSGKSELADASSPAERANNGTTAKEPMPGCEDNHEADHNSCNNSGDVLNADLNARVSWEMQANNQEIPAEIRKSPTVDAKNNNENHKLTNVQNKNYAKNLVNGSISQPKDNIDKALNISCNREIESTDSSTSRPEDGNPGTYANLAHGEGPKYDAVAIPNTEQGTLC